MEADSEAVRLVAQALQKLEPGRMSIEPHRPGSSGDEHLFLALGQRNHRDASVSGALLSASRAAPN